VGLGVHFSFTTPFILGLIFLILHITIPEMHHNNMPTGSGLWHFLYRLVHIFVQSVVSSEKEVATT